MSSRWLRFLLFAVLCLSVHASFGQVTSATPQVSFAKSIAHDQKAIWTSPFHLKKPDFKIVLPVAAAAALLIASDRKTSGWVSRYGSLPAVSHNVSRLGSVYSTAGIAAGFYLIGRTSGNSRARETGKLAAEALIDTSIVTEVLKLATERMRPNAGSGRGLFFRHGNSFPSGHTSSSWAVATVVARRYRDRPIIKYGAIALAAAVGLSRYSGRNHFLSDIIAGGAIGYGIGRFVTIH